VAKAFILLEVNRRLRRSLDLKCLRINERLSSGFLEVSKENDHSTIERSYSFKQSDGKLAAVFGGLLRRFLRPICQVAVLLYD